MRADRRDPVIASLKRFKGTRFEATLRDGTKKAIALSTKQNRWELLSDTLSVIPWVSIEALDDKGNILGALDREEDEAGEYVDEAGDRDARIAAIIAGAYANAMKESRLMFGDTMRAHTEMAVSMLESQRVLHESYSLAMKVQASQLQLPEGTGEEDKVMEMMKMAAMMYMGHKPAINITTQPPAKTPPATNGAKKG